MTRISEPKSTCFIKNKVVGSIDAMTIALGEECLNRLPHQQVTQGSFD